MSEPQLLGYGSCTLNYSKKLTLANYNSFVSIYKTGKYFSCHKLKIHKIHFKDALCLDYIYLKIISLSSEGSLT